MRDRNEPSWLIELDEEMAKESVETKVDNWFKKWVEADLFVRLSLSTLGCLVFIALLVVFCIGIFYICKFLRWWSLLLFLPVCFAILMEFIRADEKK